MRRFSAVLGMTVALTVSTFAGTTVKPTTTLAAETGNNTSAADTFKAQTNGNIGASNVSKLPLRSLLYPGATTKMYVHWMPWFGPGNHMNVGYDSSDRAQVARQVADMSSRGIEGAIVDWYGPESTHHNNATIALRDASVAHGSFKFAITEDVGALNKCAATAGCDVTQKLINDLTYAWNIFEQSPSYMRHNGRPIVFFFGLEKYTIDWVRAKASIPGSPLFIFRNSGAFSKTYGDGGYAWVTIDTTNRNNIGLAYLDNFYATALRYPSELTYGSAWKGFNDLLSGWSANRIMDQNCGQTWLATWAETAKYYSANMQLYGMQVATWNDYEEGTEIETGIENCVTVSGAVSGNTLTWSITGSESTVSQYTVFISLDGQNLMPLADVPTGVGTLDLGAYGFGPAKYTIFVKAIGKPSMVNKMSGPIAYTVANQAPTAVLSVTPTSGIAPVTVTASTAGSSDADGSITSVLLDFGDGTVVNAANASRVYEIPGTYTVQATVTDNLGAMSTQAATVTVVANKPPTAQLSISPASGIAPLNVTASTAGSTDPDGTITATVINWGDGTSTQGATGSHVYGVAGTYTITATVTDDRGATSSGNASVTVKANQAPVAKLSVTPTSGSAPLTVTASTAGSGDPDGTITGIIINWGDGTSSAAASGSHVYSLAGTYTITTTVTDDRGAKSSATASVVVKGNQPPVARLTVTPTSGVAPVTVTASTSASSDADGTIVSRSINWGDGTSSTAASASHLYSKAGTYTITATVKDDRGATSSASATVRVSWGVTVTTPTNNMSTTSPVRVIASATSNVPIVTMKIYVEYVAVYSTNAAKLDTWLKMARGTRRVVVQAWDSNGVIYKNTLYVNVK